MGICVACMERDIAGALGLHRVPTVQYLRPEIMGLVLGAFIAALLTGEYRSRGGSSPVVRFFLGCFAMVGALVFLGCPWRAILRLAGGDGNALVGLFGLTVGIGVGVWFLKRGYSLGRSMPRPYGGGWILPAFMAFLLILLIGRVSFSPGGPIFFSRVGPGASHAPLLVSLGAGLVIGGLAQRSRFCTMGAIRDMILIRDPHLISGVGAMLLAAWVTNILLGQFRPGFTGQPIAHTDVLWNFLGMVLAGLAFVLAGGCPGRQLFLSGEGDMDAAIFVWGMIVGAALAHNFNTVSSPAGVSPFGPLAVLVGLIFCLVIGMTQRDRP